MKLLTETIQMKITEYNFHVILFYWFDLKLSVHKLQPTFWSIRIKATVWLFHMVLFDIFTCQCFCSYDFSPFSL